MTELGLQSQSNNRYQRFLKKIVEQGFVYAFLGNGQIKAWVANELHCDEGKPMPLIVIWSNQAYPKAWISDHAEQELKLIPIPLDELHGLLDQFAENGFGIGAEWNQKGFGVELTTDQFRDDVTRVMTELYGDT